MCALSPSRESQASALAQELLDGEGDFLDGVSRLGSMLTQTLFFDPDSMGVLVEAADELDAVPRLEQRGVWNREAFEQARAHGRDVLEFYDAAIRAALRAVIAAVEARHDLTVTLYRPVGPAEMAAVESSGFTSWPPRLPDQPIFYPVTNEAYAARIASDWNVRDTGYGAVTRFEVRQDFMDRFEIHQVGAPEHQEWWIPAEDLDELNANIVGYVEVIAEFGTRG